MNHIRSGVQGTCVSVLRIQCPERPDGYEVQIHYDGKRMTGSCECQRNTRLGVPCWHLMTVLPNHDLLMRKRDFMKMSMVPTNRPQPQ